MVRKINKKKVKKKKIKLRSAEEIDAKIQEFLNDIRPVLGEEKTNLLFNLMKDNSNLKFMSNSFAIVTCYLGTEKTEKDLKKAVSDCKELLVTYEKEYKPDIGTVFYAGLFGINKLIGRYFKVNLFKKNFSKNNKDKLYDMEEYKRFNNLIETLPIKAEKERIFGKEWEKQINNISEKLDDLLKVFNDMKETYIIDKKLAELFKNSKDQIEFSYSKDITLTKRNKKYLRYVFGDNEELIKSYYMDTRQKYKPEYNFIEDAIFFITSLQNKDLVSAFSRYVFLVTGSKEFSARLTLEVKSLLIHLLIFIKNFEKLVADGDDNFDVKIDIKF